MSESTLATCPKCQSANPAGARFCSSCRESLGSGQASPALPTPPPAPQRPSLAGMMSQTGGKTESLTVNGDPAAVFNHLVRYVQALPGSEIKQQNAPRMIVAKIAYRDLAATGGVPVKVDATIALTSAAPGQCTVALTTKLDLASTNTLWLIFGGLLLFLIATNMFLIMQYMFLGALAAAISYWVLSTRPPTKVTEALFDDLRANADVLQNAVGPGPTVPQPAVPDPGTVPTHPAPESPESSNGAASDPDEEIFDRIKKLAELREMGAITVEDFEAKKTELLSRL